MTDQFSNWRRRLAEATLPRSQQTGIGYGPERIPTYETEIDPGYYRRPIKERTPGGAWKKVGWEAVAFWREEDGTLFSRVGNRIPVVGDDEYAHNLWLAVTRYPIAEELYFDVVDHGKPWPDMPHEPPAKPDAPVDGAATERPGPGHNAPPEDPLAAMREQIASAAGVARSIEIKTKADADNAQASRARLLELKNNADRFRKAEKEPHKQAADAVDAKYMPLVRDAETAAEEIRRKLQAFATQQAREAAEAQRKADAERAEAERAARAHAQAVAERTKAAAAGADLPPLPPPPPPPPPPPAPTAAPVAQFKGASGKAAGVQMVKVAKVTDWLALSAHYSGRTEVRELLQKLANRDAKAGLAVPGATIEEEADVR